MLDPILMGIILVVFIFILLLIFKYNPTLSYAVFEVICNVFGAIIEVIALIFRGLN